MREEFIPFIQKGETCKIFIERIIAIEQNLRKIVVVTEEGKYSWYGKITDLSGYLDGRFLRCHSSYIINMDKVIRMREQTIFFENGYTLMMGREKYAPTRHYYNEYILKQSTVRRNVFGGVGEIM